MEGDAAFPALGDRRGASPDHGIDRAARLGPIEQPAKFDLTINLTTAKAPGLTP